jgi:Uma2 family endonuclease
MLSFSLMGRQVQTKKPATYDDVRAAPEHVVAELVDDELYLSPRPAPLHAHAEGALYAELVGPFQRGRGGPGGWVILIEPELRLAGNALVPDVAGWRRERMPELPATSSIELPPDWLCEVSSPSTAALDRKVKMPKYARAGVRNVWLIDPEAQTLEVFRLGTEGRWETVSVFSHDDKVRAEPFEVSELELLGLWQLSPNPSA